MVDTTASATGRSEHMDLRPAPARWGQGAQEISSFDPALDLPWSSGGSWDLPRWAKEGNSSLCLGAKIHFNIHSLHTSRPALEPDPFHPPVIADLLPHRGLELLPGTSPLDHLSHHQKPSSGWGQHSSGSKVGEETFGSPSVHSGVCSVPSSSASARSSSWLRGSWSWTGACE